MTYGDLAIIFAGLGVTFLAATSMKPGQGWRNVYRLVVALATPTLALLIILHEHQTQNQAKTEHRLAGPPQTSSAWREGDCFTLDYGFQKERWDGPPSVYRIEEVGVAKYRVSIYLDKGWRESVLDTRKSDTVFMRKSNCPGEDHGS